MLDGGSGGVSKLMMLDLEETRTMRMCLSLVSFQSGDIADCVLKQKANMFGNGLDA